MGQCLCLDITQCGSTKVQWTISYVNFDRNANSNTYQLSNKNKEHFQVHFTIIISIKFVFGLYSIYLCKGRIIDHKAVLLVTPRL